MYASATQASPAMMRKEFRFIAAGVRNSDSGFGASSANFLPTRFRLFRRMPPAVRKTPLFRGHAALKSGMCPHQQLVDEVPVHFSVCWWHPLMSVMCQVPK
jgi:hypothetical protein